MKGIIFMKSKKLKLIVVALASLFVSTSFLAGYGKKEADEQTKTTVKEIDGKKVKVTEQGNGTAKIEMPDK
ncbi:hypothetical protein ACWOF5_05870 [Carnobacterium divergens]